MLECLVTFQMDWPIHNDFVRDGTIFDTKFKDASANLKSHLKLGEEKISADDD